MGRGIDRRRAGLMARLVDKSLVIADEESMDTVAIGISRRCGSMRGSVYGSQGSPMLCATVISRSSWT